MSENPEVRLIDANALLEAFANAKWFCNVDRDIAEDLILDAHTIDNAPDITLNIVSEEENITRCKDCNRWGAGITGETDKIKCCQVTGYMIGENGYCIYADKKNWGDGAI